MRAYRPIRGRRRTQVFLLVAAALSLAACGGSSASPTAVAASPSPAPPSTAPAASNGHCAITPDATAAATVKWNIKVEGGNPRIKAGQAVAFVTHGNERPTVTEGMNGTAVPDPCVDKVLSANTPTVVTFPKPGVYHLFCRKEPTLMFTTVYVA